jgi:hypothetical protein
VGTCADTNTEGSKRTQGDRDPDEQCIRRDDLKANHKRKLDMNAILKNTAKVILACLGMATASNFATAADLQPCTKTNNRDPEKKIEYVGTVDLWPSGGSGFNPRIGWQCFLHNANDIMSVEMDIRTPSGEHPPWYFDSVQLDREGQLAGFTMVVMEFYPNCYPNCTSDPGKLTGKYTVRFRSPATK